MIAADHVVLEDVVDLAHLLVDIAMNQWTDAARVLIPDSQLHHAPVLIEGLEVVPVEQLIVSHI